MSQTNGYEFTLDKAQAGQKAGLDFDHVESFAAEGAVPFGRGVVHGTNPEKQVAVPADDTGIFAGISVFTHSREQTLNQDATMGEQFSGGAQYRDKDTVSTLRKGRIYVLVTAAVEAGEDAYVDVLTEGEEGKFTNVDTDNLATGGVFRSAADEGELAIVEVNLPN